MPEARAPRSSSRFSGSLPEARSTIEVSYDGWPKPILRWLDGPGGSRVRTRVRRYGKTLQQITDATPVDLVIARDIAATVDRLEPSDTPYVADRGDRGTVGGRTLVVAGRPTVILNGAFLVSSADGHPELNADGAKRLTHTTRHEAQHVLMHQRRTNRYGKPAAVGAIANFLHETAARVIDEYRCEAAACRASVTFGSTPRHMLTALNTLGHSLYTSVDIYQRHGDVRRVRNDVAHAAEAFWVTSFGYFAGARNAAQKSLKLPKTLAVHPLWTRYAAGSWPAIEQLLNQVPRSDVERGDPAVRALKKRTRELGVLLEAHLRELGFVMADGPDGGSSFYIKRFDFPHLRLL